MASKFLQLIAGLVFTAITAQAQLHDVSITATRKKLDEQKTRGSMETITTQEIAYKVVVTSKAFKAIPELEVKYMIFYDDVQPGSKEKPEILHIKGKELLTNLENNRPVEFETKPIKLTKSQLDGNVYWTSGASAKAKDSVSGLWFRAYSGGKIIGEYAYPTTLPKKAEFKE